LFVKVEGGISHIIASCFCVYYLPFFDASLSEVRPVTNKNSRVFTFGLIRLTPFITPVAGSNLLAQHAKRKGLTTFAQQSVHFPSVDSILRNICISGVNLQIWEIKSANLHSNRSPYIII